MSAKTYVINRENRLTVIEETIEGGKTHWKDMRLATDEDIKAIPKHPYWFDHMLVGARPIGIS